LKIHTYAVLARTPSIIGENG